MSQTWIDREAKWVKDQRLEALESQGYRPRWLAPEGSSTPMVVLDEPRTDKYERAVFHIYIDGEHMDWPVSKKNPLYGNVIHALQTAHGNGWKAVKLEIVRTGTTASNTRYGDVKLVGEAEPPQEKAAEEEPTKCPFCLEFFDPEALKNHIKESH